MPQSAILAGDLKLIRWWESGETKLFDLAKDIGEQRNVAADHRDVVEKLRTLMDQQHTKSELFPPRPIDAPASKM